VTDPSAVPAEVIERLAEYSTPSVVNGLKRLGVATEDIESMDRNLISCISPELGVRVGVALTRRVATRRAGPPADPVRTAALAERADALLATLPAPRILVVENVGDWAGPVCIWGEVMAHVNLASGIVAGITNGPVRDVAEMAAVGFQTFAGGVGVGGGHVDMIDVGERIVVGAVAIATGDLLHGDRHGVVRIPAGLAEQLPAAMDEHRAVEARVIAVCKSPGFSSAAVAEAWRQR
jgi:regulator of RNase E activity RraA